MTAIPTAALARVPKNGALPQLIEDHRSAFKQLSGVTAKLEKIRDKLAKEREKNPTLIPTSVMPNGNTTGSGHYDLHKVGADRIRVLIKEQSDRLREIHCSRWSKTMVPKFAVAMEAAIQASYERAISALEEAEARELDQERRAGLTEAQEAEEPLIELELTLRVQLVLTPPANTREAKMKANYIAKSPPFQEGLVWTG